MPVLMDHNPDSSCSKETADYFDAKLLNSGKSMKKYEEMELKNGIKDIIEDFEKQVKLLQVEIECLTKEVSALKKTQEGLSQSCDFYAKEVRLQSGYWKSAEKRMCDSLGAIDPLNLEQIQKICEILSNF